jgi:hypothetical protein
MVIIMAANVLPLLFVGGAALLLLGKKKKKRKRAPALSEEAKEEIKELVEKTRPPQVPDLGGVMTEESSLEFEEKPTGEAAGDFKIESEDLEYDEEDDAEEAEKPPPEISPQEKYEQMRAKCDTFIDAVHIAPTQDDEMPINKIAVEQSILPAMKDSAHGFAQNLGMPLDGETIGPRLVLAGLEAVAPGCGWEFSDAEQEFRYADGKRADGGRMGQVLGAMIDLSVMVLNEFNQPQPGPQIVQG